MTPRRGAKIPMSGTSRPAWSAVHWRSITLHTKIWERAVRPLCLALLFGSVLSGGVPAAASAATASSAVAQSAPKSIRSIQVRSSFSGGDLTSTTELKFAHPVSVAEAGQYSRQLAGGGLAAAQLGPSYISCEGSGAWSDSNGKLSLQYTCTKGTGYLAWGFKLSAAVRAIVVGNINETGLRWWLNGKAKPQNAPHVVPPSYLLHGTMSGASTGSTVDYQDYITFRHNVGSGGTGSVTWSGRVHTLKD
jgi:hypothetical protein